MDGDRQALILLGELNHKADRQERHLEGMNHKLNILRDDMALLKGRSQDHTDRILLLEEKVEKRSHTLRHWGGVGAGILITITALGTAWGVATHFLK